MTLCCVAHVLIHLLLKGLDVESPFIRLVRGLSISCRPHLKCWKFRQSKSQFALHFEPRCGALRTGLGS